MLYGVSKAYKESSNCRLVRRNSRVPCPVSLIQCPLHVVLHASCTACGLGGSTRGLSQELNYAQQRAQQGCVSLACALHVDPYLC